MLRLPAAYVVVSLAAVGCASDSTALQWLGGATKRISGRDDNLATMTVQCKA